MIDSISIVIPSYNEYENIKEIHKRTSEVIKKLNLKKYEILFVDNGSTDDSLKLLKEINSKDKSVKIISLSRNFGYQSAIAVGLKYSENEYVCVMDGDLQDPPEIIENFVSEWKKGFEVVYGIRSKREASFFLRFAYKLFYRLFNKISDIRIPLDAGDFSLMDRKVVDAINLTPETDRFIRGLRAWVGFKQIGVEYYRPERKYGKTTNSFLKNIRWAKKGIFSFSYIPIELISYLSYFIVLASMCAIIWYIALYFIYPGAPRGITTILVLVLFLGGIQILSISILSEYLTKIMDETKKRPKFIIKKIINYKNIKKN